MQSETLKAVHGLEPTDKQNFVTLKAGKWELFLPKNMTVRPLNAYCNQSVNQSINQSVSQLVTNLSR